MSEKNGLDGLGGGIFGGAVGTAGVLRGAARGVFGAGAAGANSAAGKNSAAGANGKIGANGEKIGENRDKIAADFADEANECVLVVDLQTSILNVAGGEALRQNCLRALRVARELGVEIFATEQVPEKLGATDPEIAEFFSAPAAAKCEFSAAQTACAAFGLARFERVVLIGIEAHICLYQTALELLANGFGVCVLADCVGSRAAANARLALENLRGAGAELQCVESWAFLRLKTAQNPHFRAISKIIK